MIDQTWECNAITEKLQLINCISDSVHHHSQAPLTWRWEVPCSRAYFHALGVSWAKQTEEISLRNKDHPTVM